MTALPVPRQSRKAYPTGQVFRPAQADRDPVSAFLTSRTEREPSPLTKRLAVNARLLTRHGYLVVAPTEFRQATNPSHADESTHVRLLRAYATRALLGEGPTAGLTDAEMSTLFGRDVGPRCAELRRLHLTEGFIDDQGRAARRGGQAVTVLSRAGRAYLAELNKTPTPPPAP